MLNNAVKCAASNDAQFFSTHLGIPSGPGLYELFSDVKFENLVLTLVNGKEIIV